MKKILAFVLTLCIVLSLCAVGGVALAEDSVTLICDGTANYKLEAEQRDGDFDGNYVFAQYFAGGTQEAMIDGIKALIASGAVSINGSVLPTSTEQMTATEDGKFAYVLNGSYSFTVDAGAETAELIENGFATVKQSVKSAGTNVSFTLDENRFATSMALFITRGALIDEIVNNGDGTSTVIAEGAPYSVTLSGGGMMMGGGEPPVQVTVAFPNSNIGDSVAVGDIAVCWMTPEGWYLQAADRMDGYLIGGADHEDYLFRDLEGTVHYFTDADMYQRAFATANRPGGFVNTQVNFQLTEGDFPVTAWFVPGTAATEKPMIIGFTTGESARARLEAAIAYATEIADSAVVAASREEAGDDVNWVEDQATIDTLRAAISAAQAVADDDSLVPSAYDNAVYQLHLAVWGSMNDISAVFMGTAVEGFFDIANPDVEKFHVELK